MDTAVPGLGLMSLPRNFASLGKSIKLMKRCLLICQMSCNGREVMSGHLEMKEWQGNIDCFLSVENPRQAQETTTGIFSFYDDLYTCSQISVSEGF